MFDIFSFYLDLLKTDPFSFGDPWAEFPKSDTAQFTGELRSLLATNIHQKNDLGLLWTLGLIFQDGPDKSYVPALLDLIMADWHTRHEDVVDLLGEICDPIAIEALYVRAIAVPEYDEMRALATKCIHALSCIAVPVAIEKIELLAESQDSLIREKAKFYLQHIKKE